MGRRGTKNAIDNDDDEEFELEREWERKRQKRTPAKRNDDAGTKRNGGSNARVASLASDTVIPTKQCDDDGAESASVEGASPQKVAKDDEKAAVANWSTANEDKKRLKKQRQKERLRAKKAEAKETGVAPADSTSVAGDVGNSNNPDDDGVAKDAVSKDNENVTVTSTPKTDEEKAAEKVERYRLKKRLQKEKRKEKRAEAEEARDKLRRAARSKSKEREVKSKKEKDTKDRKKQDESLNRGPKYVTLNKGVKCADIVVGKGEVVQDRKKVRVSYTLRAKNHLNGKIIDSDDSYAFRLGRGEVIKGYDIGMEGMRHGGTRRLIIPKEAGYGNKDIGAGFGADLYFEIHLW